MDSIGSILLVAVLNFCGLPLVGFGIGVWVARGMPGSPVVLRKRYDAIPQHDDFNDEDYD